MAAHPTNANSDDKAICFAAVLAEELNHIHLLRKKRGLEGREPSDEITKMAVRNADSGPCADDLVLAAAEAKRVFEEAHKMNLVGLAFSGGGIRSATFNLGILQGLADLDLLRKFDYLSTVSGGGYIGSWLEAWILRAGQQEMKRAAGENPEGEETQQKCKPGIGVVEQELKSTRVSRGGHAGGEHAKKEQIRTEPRPIRFLREYSNYLTPRLGFLGADTWTAVAIYLRNLFLNQLILILFLASALLVPYIAVWISHSTGTWKGPHSFYAGPALVVFLVLLAQTLTAFNMRNLTGVHSGHEVRYRFYAEQGWILVLIVAPLFVAAWITSAWLWANFNPSWPWWSWILLGGVGYGLAWSFAALCNLPESGPAAPHWNSTRAMAWSVVFSLLSGGVGGYLLRILTSQVLAHWNSGKGAEWHVVSFGTPLVMLAFLLVGALQIGLMGFFFPDPRREWWGRLGGYLLMICIVWAAGFALAIYSPLGLMWLKGWVKGLGIAWIGTTLVGLIGGKNASTGGAESRSWKDIALSVTPYVFIVGILAVVAWLLELVLALFNGMADETLSNYLIGSPVAQKVGGWLVALDYSLGSHSLKGTITPASPLVQPTTYIQAHWTILDGALNCRLFVLFAVLLITCFFLSWRVNLNEFSMNLLYRNRLVRAYLGASHSDRHPNPFTGFDPSDDLQLKDLRSDRCYSGPLPIINTTLNLVGGKDLAWQQRKAESFILTPVHCGFDAWLEKIDLKQGSPMPRPPKISRYAYRPTERFLYDCSTPPRHDSGPRLGTAISVSGAAASPNMGYHSSPSLAFLMTFFNVRLGLWAGNPRHDKTWTLPGPRLGLFHLLAELFGQTDDEARYVYLSDGGHFENLGVYELVKRRCKYIIACDAGADPDYTLDDLGSAIRKCREDIGVEINLVSRVVVPPEETDGNNSKSKRKLTLWHCVVGEIRYGMVDPGAEPGMFVYVKASLTGDEPADVLNYQTSHRDFPHQTTADQWFAESQFESYRRLGQHIVEAMFKKIKVAEVLKEDGLAALFKKLEGEWEEISAKQALEKQAAHRKDEEV